MMRKDPTTWAEDTAHAARVGAVVLMLALIGMAILRPMDHGTRQDEPAGQAEVKR